MSSWVSWRRSVVTETSFFAIPSTTAGGDLASHEPFTSEMTTVITGPSISSSPITSTPRVCWSGISLCAMRDAGTIVPKTSLMTVAATISASSLRWVSVCFGRPPDHSAGRAARNSSSRADRISGSVTVSADESKRASSAAASRSRCSAALWSKYAPRTRAARVDAKPTGSSGTTRQKRRRPRESSL